MGVDPETGKFTNGDFSNPEIPPSYFPAQTINLVLENLANLIAATGETPNNFDADQLKNVLEWIQKNKYEVGDFFAQWPDTQSPAQRGWAGEWSEWSARAVIYGLSSSVPPSAANYYSLVGQTIAVNTYVKYNKPGDDTQLFRCKTEHTAPAELNPINFDIVAPNTRAARQSCGNPLTADDLNIGDQITSGAHAGMYVTEVIVPGGKFPSIEGGFRPTFISGGSAPDVIRNITGWLGGISATVLNAVSMGALYWEYIGAWQGSYTTALQAPAHPSIDVSRVVSTGPQNSPRTLSVRLWRRVL
jgi:hypothetical protein